VEPIDYLKLSAEELQPLAEQGYAEAQNNLGMMYYFGDGVPQDYQEAVKWYRKAAEQGQAEAQYNLGVLYDQGKGVPQDSQEAVKWYRRAAEQGYAGAQGALGYMYAEGKGVPKDYVLAYKWVNLAAAQGHKNASNNRDVLDKRMNTSQIQEAQRLAREFKPEKEDPKQQKNKKYFERLTTFLKWINFCEGGYILEALSEKWG